MLYRENQSGEKISQLGLGCMRFTRKAAQIDQEKATEIIRLAIEGGVNYFDTAYIYPGSEEALGKALKSLNKRDEVKIATKLPPYLCKSGSDFDKIFNKQLQRLKTDRIDYYLIHMLADMKAWERLQSFGIEQWIEKKKAEGKIINIGFSFHGGKTEFMKLVDAYPFQFCMVQYNYLDEFNQASRDGVRYAHSKGLTVFIMEPLRGGMLATGLPKTASEIFEKADKKRSMADWGLTWLWNQPEVTMVLSGMNSTKQLKENLELASKARVGDISDLSVYERVVKTINSSVKVPCTSCAYCMPCPQGVDIPTCFSCYNEVYTQGFMSALQRYFMTTGQMSMNQTNASKCIKCGKCEAHCPQKIKISKRLGEVSKKLEPFWFNPAFRIARKLMLKVSKD